MATVKIIGLIFLVFLTVFIIINRICDCVERCHSIKYCRGFWNLEDAEDE